MIPRFSTLKIPSSKPTNDNVVSTFWTHNFYYDDQQITVNVDSWIDKPEIILANLVSIAEYRKET
jgi:hypothetical protein